MVGRGDFLQFVHRRSRWLLIEILSANPIYMATASLPFEVPRPVAQKVSRLRRLVRLYSLAEGLAAVAIVVGLGFWLGLTIDWMFEPQPALRVALWSLV